MEVTKCVIVVVAVVWAVVGVVSLVDVLTGAAERPESGIGCEMQETPEGLFAPLPMSEVYPV